MHEPLEKGYVTQGFHSKHRANDIGWKSYLTAGEIPYLLAVDDGVVIVSQEFKTTGAGFQVALDIPSGNPNYKYMVSYAHNKENLVKVGDKVKRGQRIAIGGSTGNSTGPHVHLEVWKVPINFKFTGYNYGTYREKYALPPNDLVNFLKISGNNIIKVTSYTEKPLSGTKATTTYSNLNMRDYPTTKAFSAGYMPEELKALAETTKIDGYEWVKCEWNGRKVYVAKEYVELVNDCDPVIIEKEVIVEVVKEVDRPFKEIFERNGITVTIERK